MIADSIHRASASATASVSASASRKTTASVTASASASTVASVELEKCQFCLTDNKMIVHNDECVKRRKSTVNTRKSLPRECDLSMAYLMLPVNHDEQSFEVNKQSSTETIKADEYGLGDRVLQERELAMYTPEKTGSLVVWTWCKERERLRLLRT
jgi:hypothetical protein